MDSNAPSPQQPERDPTRRSSELGERARAGWQRWSTRVRSQAGDGAELARLERDQLVLQREVPRRQQEVGRLVADAFAENGSPIVVEGALAMALGSLADAVTALDGVTDRLAETGARMRGKPRPGDRA